MYTVVDPVPVEEPEPENDDDAWGVIANNGANDNEVLPRQSRGRPPTHQDIHRVPLVAQNLVASPRQTKAAEYFEIGQQELCSPFWGNSPRLEEGNQKEERQTHSDTRRPPVKGLLVSRYLPARWRQLPLLWTLLSWIILSVHIFLTYSLPQGSYGLGILGTSAECSSLRSKKRKWGLFFNLMATAIFFASNSVMQLLVAPTRTDLDAAHAKAKYMDIGIQSVKNLRYLGPRRFFIWLLLVLPSLTLHAFYNGLLYTVTPTRQAYEVIVSENFLNPGLSLDLLDLDVNEDQFLSKSGPAPPAIPAKRLFGLPELQSSLISLKQHGSSPQWNKSDLLDCFGKSIHADAIHHPNIVLVVNWTNPFSNNAVLGVEDMGDWDTEFPALCPLSFYNNVTSGIEVLNASTVDSPGFYTFEGLLTNHDVGVSCIIDLATGLDICSICPTYYKKIPSYKPQSVPFVMYCYNEVVHPGLCHLAYSTSILKIIVVMLAFKAAGLTLAMIQLRKKPIIVLGDAIREYLRSPDQQTVNCSLRGQRFVKEALPIIPEAPWKPEGWTRRTMEKFYDSTTGDIWLLFAIATAATYYGIYKKVPDLKVNLILASPGLESDTTWIVKPSLVVNSVQILASIRASLEIGALNRGRANAEFQAFSTVRSGLRVTSQPAGKQKRPYLIHRSVHSVAVVQLLSALYAWILASCLYGAIFSLDFINKPPEMIIPSFNLMTISDSAKGHTLVAFLFILPGFMYLIMPLVSRFKLHRWWFASVPVAPPSMPHPGASSRAISVACHPNEEEGDISSEEIQWGVVKQRSGETPGRLAFTKLSTLDVSAEDKYFGAHVPEAKTFTMPLYDSFHKWWYN